MQERLEVRLGIRPIGRLRYHWVTQKTIAIDSLVTLHPMAIWVLKRQLYRMPWKQILFKQHKTRQWKRYQRRMTHAPTALV